MLIHKLKDKSWLQPNLWTQWYLFLLITLCILCISLLLFFFMVSGLTNMHMISWKITFYQCFIKVMMWVITLYHFYFSIEMFLFFFLVFLFLPGDVYCEKASKLTSKTLRICNNHSSGGELRADMSSLVLAEGDIKLPHKPFSYNRHRSQGSQGLPVIE